MKISFTDIPTHDKYLTLATYYDGEIRVTCSCGYEKYMGYNPTVKMIQDVQREHDINLGNVTMKPI